MSERIQIFDTTLRDGEQSPGCSMGIREKLRMVHQLELLNVDVIEAGFPIASQGDFDAVREVSEAAEKAVIAALCRATHGDIERGWEAVRSAKHPRIHTFIATSEIHLKYKLRKTSDQVIREAVEAVTYAKNLCRDVEFSCEDATRTDILYLAEIVEAAIDAGATVINLPDTVGYATPAAYGAMFRDIRNRVPSIDRTILSAHCHNDLGLAVANSLSAILNGARQIECTVNGIGERAGNASLEEIVMAIRTRKEKLGFDTTIVTEEIYKSSKLLSSLTGMIVQRNKAIVGANAFAHEAGIHQDGVLKSAITYEIMTPQSVGIKRSSLVLGKHSGRHALRNRYQELGYELSREELDDVYERFCDIADRKKEIHDEDLIAIIDEASGNMDKAYSLTSIQVQSGTSIRPTAVVELSAGGEDRVDSATGDGPVDAAYKAIERITGISGDLSEYTIKSVTSGRDALAEVFVSIEFDGIIFNGKGLSTDVITGSVIAYIEALNKAVRVRERKTNGSKENAVQQTFA